MLRILTFLMMWFAATAAWAGDTIRSFPLPTIVALGVKLYQQDKIAADAFDFLFSARPEAKVLPLRGWITQSDQSIKRVYFIQGPDDQHPSLAYTLTLVANGSAKIAEGHGDPLPDFVAKRYTARKAAIAAIPKFAPDRSYNYEVLDDPDEKGGFLVYALATSNDPDEVVVGGHYRVTVAENGTVKRVDALSKSFLALNKRANIPKGSASAGLYMSHLVSETPVETHVYLSILHRIRLFVTTPDNTMWKVEEGIITKVEPTLDLKLSPTTPDLKLEPKR
jgi:hypothetical protein